jgi:hypothetical protein
MPGDELLGRVIAAIPTSMRRPQEPPRRTGSLSITSGYLHVAVDDEKGVGEGCGKLVPIRFRAASTFLDLLIKVFRIPGPKQGVNFDL